MAQKKRREPQLPKEAKSLRDAGATRRSTKGARERSSRHWYLVCYDIRCPKRWRKAYKLIEGYGDRLQYSIFRCWLSQKAREKMRWELEKILTEEDDLILIRLSHQCVKALPLYNRPNTWIVEDGGFRIV